MTEPPRPPGEGGPWPDPTSPPPPGSHPMPGEGYPPPSSGGAAYPPPTPGGGAYPPPTPDGGYPPGGGYPGGPGGYPGGPGPSGYPGGPGPSGYPGGPGPSGYPGGPGGHPGGPAPAGYANSDEKTWALIAHFGGVLVGFIAPLVAMLAKGNESPTVRAHAVEALNFQITWGIATIAASILAVCSFGILSFLPLITLAIMVIFAIVGGIKANEGSLYRYPMSYRMVT
ncbi:DUF4870 domain-containing protein [Plantactinospora sp. CA-290183]|uniref:DUF4870 domain-containing protein n=1 Tax=Plantactinospora sp. CA-290183 TaxID=3240006 RepID=UPI003D8AE10F